MRGKVSPKTLGFAITFLFIALYLISPSFLDTIELKMFDLRLKRTAKSGISKNVCVVAIDEKSLEHFGRWPWSREIFAKLIDSISSAGPKVIGVDVVFPEPQKSKGNPDKVLADSIKRAGCVVLGYFMINSKKEVKNKRLSLSILRSKYDFVKTSGNLPPLIEFSGLKESIPEIANSASLSGYFNVFPDMDGTVRRIPLVIQYRDYLLLPLSLSVFKLLKKSDIAYIIAEESGVKEIRLDGFRIPTDEFGRIIINYRKGDFFPVYSAADVMSKDFPKKMLKDKIVLVGATAVGIYDMRVTPLSEIYPGVLVHANIISNLILKDFFIKPRWSQIYDILLILFLGSILGILLPRKGAVFATLFSFSLAFFLIVSNLYLFSKNLWLNLTYPLLLLISLYSGISGYRFFLEEREKRKIKGAFSQYVSEKVVNEVLAHPERLKLGGEKRELTVLFSDIRGFTTISEGMDPEVLVSFLNEYLTVMTDIVFKYDGVLDKYMGDAIMAIWGAPIPQEDHAKRACLAALDMIFALSDLNKRWKDKGLPPLNIGIGINTGEMVVGNMGSLRRFDYTVMGDNVNLGSRLEGANKQYGTSIIISEFTYEKVKGDFVCRPLDAVRVKGKREPVYIYELLARKEEAKRELLDFVESFSNCISIYREKDFYRAKRCFDSLLLQRDGDFVTRMYIERCDEYIKNPPPDDWDGVYVMKTK